MKKRLNKNASDLVFKHYLSLFEYQDVVLLQQGETTNISMLQLYIYIYIRGAFSKFPDVFV